MLQQCSAALYGVDDPSVGEEKESGRREVRNPSFSLPPARPSVRPRLVSSSPPSPGAYLQPGLSKGAAAEDTGRKERGRGEVFNE